LTIGVPLSSHFFIEGRTQEVGGSCENLPEKADEPWGRTFLRERKEEGTVRMNSGGRKIGPTREMRAFPIWGEMAGRLGGGFSAGAGKKGGEQ